MFDLEKTPPKKDEHIWADYIELLALQNLDGEIFKADVLDRTHERKDVGEGDLNEETIDYGKPNKSPEVIERNDKETRFFGDCFRILSYRSGAFRDTYPFIVGNHGNLLKRKDSLTSHQKLYILLLLAANLRVITKGQVQTEITSYFEVVSMEALKNYLPNNSAVIMFGKNQFNKDKRFSGKLYDKIVNLAADLHEQVNPGINENSFKSQNSGDGGLDLVGYLPFQDEANGMIYVFCQCACSPDEWVAKQHEASQQNWDSNIIFSTYFPHMVFIPACFRDSSGQWHDQTKIRKSILVDRVRIVNLLQENPNSLQALLPFPPAVDDFIKTREAIY